MTSGSCPACMASHALCAIHNPQEPRVVLSVHPYASPQGVAAQDPERTVESFRAYNADRHVAGLEVRERIATIIRDYATAHGGKWPSARQVAYLLTPDGSAEPPTAIRTVQWHMRALRTEAARCAVGSVTS